MSLAAVRQAVAIPLPRPEGRPLFLPGLRVVFALYAPLLLGLAIGNVGMLVPVAVGALVSALADPGGATARRTATVLGTSVFGATAFVLGDLAGRTPLSSISFVVVLLFVTGLGPEFGAAGIRAGLYVATVGILGVSSAGVDPGWVTPTGLLVGGIWALALAIGPFRQRGRLSRPIDERIIGFKEGFWDHALLRTAIGRHAARVAVAGGLGLALSLAIGRGHVGWIVAAAVAVLHPQATAHPKRGARLLSGTVLGALAIVLLLKAVAPGAILLALAAPLLMLAVSVRTVDYVSYTVAFTAFMLALASFGDSAPWSLFDARVVDTLIGIAIALAVWYLTMSRAETARLQGELAER